MPDEIFSEKNRTADDGGLAKTLFYDIVRQLRVPAAIASVDASNCYDRIAHAIASLVFQSFGVKGEAVQSMLEAIQEMKFFLRTAYGDSKDFAGSTIEVKMQGLCQGNGAAPAGWCVISITILRCHKRKGHGAHFLAPISAVKRHLAAILYVNDTDILHLDMNTEELVAEAHEALQESVLNWVNLLIATGGTLKPAKCFHTLILFEWDAKGRWKYSRHEADAAAEIVVPVPDGSLEPIEHVSVETPKETLGIVTCPAGPSKGGLDRMRDNARGWADSAVFGSLHRRMLWFGVERQFWPKVGYGLCCSLASLKELEGVMQPTYRRLMPLGRMIRTAKKGIRQLDHGFYGAGFPHPGVEAAVSQLNKLLMHIDCDTAVGFQLQTSVELMLTELGLSLQPFSLDYAKYGSWLTMCWLKTVWEKVAAFGFDIRICNVPLAAPKEGDRWLMEVFSELGFSAKELERLNRVRVHQQALFLSDVCCAAGRYLDARYHHLRELDAKWSKLKFSNEDPTRSDLALWRRALKRLAPNGVARYRPRASPAGGHKIWDWRYCDEEDTLYHIKGDTMDVYPRSLLPRHTGRNKYTRQCIDRPVELRGEICTAEEVAPAVWRVRSYSVPAPPATMPSTFTEVLEEWGCTWLWDDLDMRGGVHWLAEAIEAGSLVAVTDGSYLRELYPNVCSACFILECKEGRGRLIGSLAEKSAAANAYRGELLGLMAVHLLLLAETKVTPGLRGSVEIVSDCLGALSRVAELPPHRIPSRCRHSDILKNILVNCSDLPFERRYVHVKAHQVENGANWDTLPRRAQLNTFCDTGAKERIWELDCNDLPRQEPFPLEPICLFVGDEKMTSDTGAQVRFAAQRAIAKEFFHGYDVLFGTQFEEVAWQHVYRTLRDEVPRLFQLWASKQVMRTSATNWALNKRDPSHNNKCPCCTVAVETHAHVLLCEEAGRVEAFSKTVDCLESWLDEVDTDPELAECIVDFVRGRGSVSMEEVCRSFPPRLARVGRSQDVIGWQRLLEGMISKEIPEIQMMYMRINGSRQSIERWTSGLITRLLEITHGQWLYRNFMVHDTIAGTIATQRKEELQREIERQQELGDDGLLEEDKYLAEVNLECLESSSGERQEYWLLAIKAARKAKRIYDRRRAVAESNTNRDGS